MSRARKRLGQHFLHDRRVVCRILDIFDPDPDDIVVEIGSGQGVLTRELVPRVAYLHAIELDPRLAMALSEELASFDNARIHQADALAIDYRRFNDSGRKLRLIGNLPYSVSTPLLFHLLQQTSCIQDMCFMLQREVADRLCARPGNKTYGRLGVMVQWRCQIERLFVVKSGAFQPAPKVDSALVRLRPHTAPPAPVMDEAVLADVVAAVFSQRRKTLRNALKGILTDSAIAAIGIDPGRRGETLTLKEFARLSDTATRAAPIAAPK
ncbi:MAG: 16S rRNA (adenine(1518)-N(6)/adenine(1519)-N(6))-dimethyltransferase RsmA [Acidiferrobacterales bacterium]